MTSVGLKLSSKAIYRFEPDETKYLEARSVPILYRLGSAYDLESWSQWRDRMRWMGNAWVVGIVTGIVSGLLVTWLLRVLISKRKTREYKQQLSSANREVIYSIRAGIPEGNMPSGESLRQ